MADTTSRLTSDVIDSDGLVDDDIDLQAIADSEIPEIQHEAQTWLVANNADDQRAITIFAFGIAVCAVLLQSWWAALLAVCILLVLPFRWMAGPQFRDGNIQRGIMWANLGSWYLLFPLVIIVPDSLPIAIQNVIGPMILAAAYLERRVVRRLVPVTIMIAVTITFIAYTTDGVGLDEVTPEWLYVTVLLTYTGANLYLVTTDLRQSNVVRLRIMQRAINNNRELAATDQALRNSRRRLVMAADQERVSLERNLHDGAQQRLLSLAIQLRLAADLADEGTPPTSESLFAMHHAVTDAVEELRDLAQGVYPARLTELGLARALHAVARRSPLQIEIDDTTVGAIDDGTEVALYFVCLEAIQNASKHGGPGTVVRISLDTADDDLVMSITDSGPGFNIDEHANSRGLLNMADRVGALGGELSIDSAPGSGTAVSARLPQRPTAIGASSG
jgi:signal transduction histidine kinase